MAYIRYDTEKMGELKLKYRQYVRQMNKLQKRMEKMVSELRGGWQSGGGDAFFEKFSDEWLKGFVHYQEVLSHMADNLDAAHNSYTEITEEANRLRIK